MSNQPRTLDQIQRWMQSVIAHPDGVEAGVNSSEARQQISAAADQVDCVILPASQMSSLDRLAVYGNAYYARLLECMRDEFPALVQAIGDEAFDGLAFGYLQRYPSSSYTLADLSKRFPHYLRETRPDDGEPAPNWADFLIELAMLERIYSEVFDGSGPERLSEQGQRLLNAEDLLAVGAERWPQTRLQLVPWLRLEAFQYPVHQYASAVRVRDEHPTPPAPSATFLAITRQDYVVRRLPLSHPQFELLSAFNQDATVAAAIQAAAAVFDGSLPDLADSLHRWFEDWSAAGLFAAVHLPDDGK